MAVLANPSRDRHEAGTSDLRWPMALGRRPSSRRAQKHDKEDRTEPAVAPDGAGRHVSQCCRFCGSPRSCTGSLGGNDGDLLR